jgi:hypothetical protein
MVRGNFRSAKNEQYQLSRHSDYLICFKKLQLVVNLFKECLTKVKMPEEVEITSLSLRHFMIKYK